MSIKEVVSPCHDAFSSENWQAIEQLWSGTGHDSRFGRAASCALLGKMHNRASLEDGMPVAD